MHFFIITQDRDIDFVADAFSIQDFRQIGIGIDFMFIDSDDDIVRLYACLIRAASFDDFRDQHTVGTVVRVGSIDPDA